MRIAGPVRVGVVVAALLLDVAGLSPAVASHYEDCELQGRIGADLKPDVGRHSIALSFHVESATQRHDDGLSGYADCGDYVGRTLDLTLSRADIAGRTLRAGDTLAVRRRLIDSSDGATNEIVDVVRPKPASP